MTTTDERGGPLLASNYTDPVDRLLLEAQRAAQRGEWPACMSAADEVLKIDPGRAEAQFLAGVALRQTGCEGAALQMFHLASRQHPGRAPIWYNLAACLHERRPRDAYKALRKAHELKPDDYDTLSCLVNVSSVLGRHAEAIEWAERVEALYGVRPETMHNKSFALFALGRWEEGWRAFKPSLGQPDRKRRNYHADRETPRWRPDKHENAVVVVYGEQGLGDEILYASMLDKAMAAAEEKGSRIVIECWNRNMDLFRDSFDVPVYGTLHEAYCDWPHDEGVTHKLEMGGLGEYFALEPFRRGAFLSADPTRRSAHRAWLDASAGCGGASPVQVGIAWTGGSWATGRERRSIPAELVAKLIAEHPGVTFVCLEYEDRRDELQMFPANVLNPHWATRKGADTADLAALVSCLDLVIAPQTSVVDVCGGLGVPCWALADATPQWRYSETAGETRMWFYESVRVFRQKQGDSGDWTRVMDTVSRALGEMRKA